MSRLYRCKSGQHRWLEREKARKCCNTHQLVVVEVPRGGGDAVIPVYVPGREAEIAFGFKLVEKGAA